MYLNHGICVCVVGCSRELQNRLGFNEFDLSSSQQCGTYSHCFLPGFQKLWPSVQGAWPCALTSAVVITTQPYPFEHNPTLLPTISPFNTSMLGSCHWTYVGYYSSFLRDLTGTYFHGMCSNLFTIKSCVSVTLMSIPIPLLPFSLFHKSLLF